MPRSALASFRSVPTVLLAALAIGVLIASAAAREGGFGAGVSAFALDNGLEVVVVADRRAPIVTHMIWYKVGAADEPPGKSGLAHLLEHLHFAGTERHPEGEFSDVVAELGGEDNAFTGSDYTAYYQRVARQHLGLMMSYEADRMANLTVSDAQVARELDIVLEERLSEVENDPAELLAEAVDALLFVSHPYRRPIVGWRHEIEALTRDDVVAFYDRYYTPNNAILVVAGDVSAEEVRVLAEATYGRVARRGETGPRVRPREPVPSAVRIASLTSRLVDQESVARNWLVPSYSTAADGEAGALELLAELLSREGTGRLHRVLVVEEELASSVSGWYQGTALDETRFSVTAEPRAGKTLEELADGFDRVVRALVEGGLPEDELERAKRSLIAETIYARDDQEALAQVYGSALATGSTVERVNGWIDAIRAVSGADVVAAAERYLVPERSATGFLRKARPPAE